MAVVGLAAAFSFLNAVSSFSKRSKASQTAPSVPSPGPAPVSSSSSLHTSEIAKGVKSRFQDWARDPFAAGGDKTTEAEIPGLSLNGIAWDSKKPQAIINGQIVSEGSVIDDYTVVKIQPTVVTLSNGNANFELKLGKKF